MAMEHWKACTYCWDYGCIDPICQEKERIAQETADRIWKENIDLIKKTAKEAIDEDNKKRYEEYLSKNGGITDFERMTENFKDN